MAVPYSRYIVGSLPWYSVLMVGSILLAYWLGTREEKRLALPADSMLDMMLVAVPCGIVGARLYYVLMSLDQFADNPISVFFIWEGGIAVYGSILGGALGVFLYCRARKRSFASLMDISAPGLALAQAIGRWGNYFNREAYGPVITNPAWQFFPAGVLISENGAPVWHVAAFFYESMWDLGVFAVLWAIRKKVRRRGDLFFWYMALYGSGRYLVEQLRSDSLYLFGLRASQWLSVLMLATVAAVFLARLARDQRGFTITACLCACLLAMIRPLLPDAAASVAVILVLYAAALIFLWLDPQTTRFARYWLLFDLVLYLLLLVLGWNRLWQSPYFPYAGLSIPVYLSIPYARLSNPVPASPNGQAEEG